MQLALATHLWLGTDDTLRMARHMERDLASAQDYDGVSIVCPAEVSLAELAQMQALGVRAFQAVGGRGLARVDFFLTADGLVVNELNTMPGFTPISMFPKCWVASGLSYGDLITELVEAGLRR